MFCAPTLCLLSPTPPTCEWADPERHRALLVSWDGHFDVRCLFASSSSYFSSPPPLGQKEGTELKRKCDRNIAFYLKQRELHGRPRITAPKDKKNALKVNKTAFSVKKTR